MVKRILKRNYGAGFIILLFILSITLFHTTSAEAVSEKIILSFSFTEPEITEENISGTTYHRVTIQNLYNLDNPGFPILPMKPLKILLPQEGELESVNVTYTGKTSLGDGYNVILGPETLNSSGQQNDSYFDPTIPYPTGLFRNVGIFDYRGYSIFIVNLFPVHYINDTGEIYYYENMTITIKTIDTGSISPWFRGLSKDEIIMKEKVNDYSRINTYSSIPSSPGNSSIVNSSEEYDFVIITKEDFAKEPNFPPDWRWWYTFQDLVDYKNSNGFNTKMIEIEDILVQPEYHWNGIFGDGQNESIFNDTQCHIRNFIKDAYRNWNIDYVLLGGDDYSITRKEIVPARNLHYVRGANFQTGSLPSDLYYACLNDTFNENDDGYWGTAHDGAPGGDSNEPNVHHGKYYAEAGWDKVDLLYDVGLFSPPLNLSGHDSVTIKFCCYTRRVNNVWANVSVYSGGSNSSTSNYDKLLWSNHISEDLDGDQEKIFNLSGISDNTTVYIAFSFKNESGTQLLSFDIDNISCWIGENNQTLILNESFEEDTFPPNNWSIVNFNSSRNGNWIRECYKKDVDLMAEVYIGRAPAGNCKEVSNFVKKTLAYEKIKPHDPYLKNILMVGQKLDDKTWGGTHMDELINQSNAHNITTYGIPNETYNISKLYDMDWQPDNDWPVSVLKDKINKNNESEQIHIISNAGHGKTNKAMKMKNIGTLDLKNSKYCFVYSWACLSGGFDNCYPLDLLLIYLTPKIKALDCFAEYLTVKTKYGAFAAIMNARWGTYADNNTYSASQIIIRKFYNSTFGNYTTQGGTIPELGKANQDSKEETLNLFSLTDCEYRRAYVGLNLLGDPTIALKLPGKNNTAPNPPSKPWGYANPTFMKWWTYHTKAYEPDDDQIKFQWEWDGTPGEHWWGPYDSNETITMIYRWPTEGNHTVRVRVKDEFGAKSDWSDYFNISVSFNANIECDSSPVVLGNEVQFTGMASGGSEPYTSWY